MADVVVYKCTLLCGTVDKITWHRSSLIQAAHFPGGHLESVALADATLSSEQRPEHFGNHLPCYVTWRIFQS